MSQETLAWLAQTSSRTIRRIETRQVNPRLRTLENISVALGESADFFVFWECIRQGNRRRQVIDTNRRRRAREAATA